MVMTDERDVENVASATECTGLVPALTDKSGEAQTRGLLDVTQVNRPHRRHKKS